MNRKNETEELYYQIVPSHSVDELKTMNVFSLILLYIVMFIGIMSILTLITIGIFIVGFLYFIFIVGDAIFQIPFRIWNFIRPK